MTDPDTKALREALAKAQLKLPIRQYHDEACRGNGDFEDANGYLGHAEYDEDAALIVAAINALPALLDRSDELDHVKAERDEALCLAEGPSTLLDLARGAIERGFALAAAESALATALRERDEARREREVIRKSRMEEGEALRAQCVTALRERDEARRLLARYANETPLGHQPHMIVDKVAALFAALSPKETATSPKPE